MTVGQLPTQAPTMPETVDPGDTRALILRTAEALFMQHGYDSVSMNQLVEEVSRVRKLSKPAIYYYFADKEALFSAVLLNLMERHGRAIAAAGATEGDLSTRVIALAAALSAGSEYFLRIRSAIGEMSAASRERFKQAMRADLFAPLVTAFVRAAERGDLRPGISPSVAASALIGIVGNLSFGETLDATGTDIATLAADLLLGGIAAR